MGIFDIFTTDAQDRAAADQRAGITSGLNTYNSFADQSRGALTGSYDQGINALINQYSQGQGSLGGNYGAGINALNANNAGAISSLTGNYGAGIAGLGQQYQQGIGAWSPVQQGANAGATQYGNALGLNGPQGNAAATAGFWNNPGIQAQLDMGSENVLRNQARTGQLASGATNTALQDYGQKVASQNWNNYVNQLNPYLSQQTQAAAGVGNLYSGYGNQLAQQYANLGQGQAGIYQGLGSQLAGQYGQLGQGLNTNQMNLGNQLGSQYANLGGLLAGNYTNQGQAGYGAATSIGNANANADLASLQASGNIWNTALGVAGAAAGSPGLMSGLGNLATGFGNTAGGGGAVGRGTGGSNPTSGFNWSDARIKDGIEKLAEMADGTNIYRFRYKGDPARRTHIGLMAQEVEKKHPEAVIEIGGIKAVDYGRATDFAANMMKLAA